jgi:cytochrome P450
MCPPAVGTSPRRSNKDMDLAGTLIPEGTPLNADIYAMHHDPNIWKDPETFIPERFASGGESESKAGRGLAWAPFGNGARQCIGKDFRTVKWRMMLAWLLKYGSSV